MDELSQQINQILSDPQSMQQIQSMMSALGMGDSRPAAPPPQQPQPQPPPPPQAPAANSGGLGAGLLGGVTPEMLQMVSRMAPLLSEVNREDDSTRLLRALRPLLSPPRQQKLDEAIKILHLMRLLPVLKDSGMFSGLLSGLL